MNKNNFKKQSGFTLIETLVAVLVLSISVGGLLALAAGGFYSVRYARNQIVANNLLQESIEYIRNTRDTAFIQGLSWDQWQDTLQTDTSGNQTGIDVNGCFSTDGCIINPYSLSASVKQCPGTCPYILYYPDNGFYGYEATYPFIPVTPTYQTSFVRTIKIGPSATNPDQLIVWASIAWLNGTNPRTVSQSILITNWTP